MSEIKNGNLPAYPISEEETDRIDAGITIYSGLTKREYFAAMAMQGLADNKNLGYDDTAKVSVKLADALLKELEKQNQ